MSGPFIKTEVDVMQSSCVMCGCTAYDTGEREDSAVAQFVRRLAWAGEAAGVNLEARITVNKDKTFVVHRIEVVKR